MRGIRLIATGFVLAAWGLSAAAQAPDPRLQRAWQLAFESDARRGAGDLAGAEQLARAAEAICPQLGRLEPFCLVPSRQRLGNVALDRGQFDLAERIYRETLALAEAAYPPPSPWHVQLRQQVADAMSRQGRVGATEAILRPALAAAREMEARYPGTLPALLNQLAMSLFAQRRWAESEEAALEAVRVLERSDRRADPTYDMARLNAADAMQRQGRLPEADTLVAAVLADRERRLGPEHRDLGLPSTRLAGLRSHQGRADEAVALARRGVGLLRHPLAPPSLDLAEALNTLGAALYEAGRGEEASSAFEESIAVREAAGDRASAAMAITLTNFANLHTRQGSPAQAEPLLRRALAIREMEPVRDDEAIAYLLAELGFALRNQGKLDEAETASARLDGAVAALPGTHVLWIRAAHLRGDLAWRRGRPAEAVDLLQQTRARLTALRGRADPHMPGILFSLGLAQIPAGDRAAGEASLAAIIDPSPLILVVHADVLARLGRTDEARARLREAARSGDAFLAAHIETIHALIADRSGDRAEADRRFAAASRLLDQPAVQGRPRWLAGELTALSSHALASGRSPLALDLAERAVAAAEATPPDALLFDAMRALVQARMAVGDRDGARRLLDRQHALAQSVLPADHPRRAGVDLDLAALAQFDARYEEAERFATDAATRFARSRNPDGVAEARNLAAIAAMALGRLDDAEAGLRAALEAADAAASGPTSARLDALANLSATLRRAGRIAAAVATGREALAVAESVYGDGHPALAPVLNVLGLALRRSERPGEAIPVLERALALRQRGDAANDPVLARAFANLGSTLLDEGRIAEAAPLIERGAAAAEAALGPAHPDVTDALAPLADLRSVLGDIREAERLHRRIVRILEDAFGPRHPALGVALAELSGAVLAAGRVGEAVVLSGRSISILAATRPATHPQLVAARAALGQALLAAGRPAEADEAFAVALRAAEAGGEDGRDSVVPVLLGMARSRAALLRGGEALALAERALGVAGQRVGPAHPRSGAIRLLIADLLAGQQRMAEAERIYRDEIAARQERVPPGTPELEFLKLAFAELLASQGRSAEAGAVSGGAIAALDSRLAPDDPRRAALLSSASTLALDRGDVAEGERRAAEAVAAHEGAGLPADAARAGLLRRLAVAALMNDRPDAASQALAAARAIAAGEDAVGVAALDARIGAAIAARAGRVREAEDELARYWALAARADPPDRMGQAAVHAVTGRLRLSQRRIEEAIRSFEAALVAATAAGSRLDRPVIAAILLGLAEAYQEAGHEEDAARARNRAAGILERIGWARQPPGLWL